MSSLDAHCRLRSPEDLLGAVPFLLGFHPSDSIVAVFIAPEGEVRCVGRANVDEPVAEVIAQFRAVLAGRSISHVALVGYGRHTNDRVLNDVLHGLRRDATILCGLWVSQDEYRCAWDGCDCLASHGVPFDPRATVSAAILTSRGYVAATSRAAVVAELAVDRAAQAVVLEAIEQQNGRPASFTVADALQVAERGEKLDNVQAGALASLLRQPQARDQAWLATDDQPWQRQLWFDLTRRVPDSHAGPVATLAAWWAWRTGNEMLAVEALRRALDCDPHSGFTQTIATLITAKIDPASLPWPMNLDEATPALRARG
jgi:hypothetical protein